jgi:hypothetical protein
MEQSGVGQLFFYMVVSTLGRLQASSSLPPPILGQFMEGALIFNLGGNLSSFQMQTVVATTAWIQGLYSITLHFSESLHFSNGITRDVRFLLP